MDVLSEFSEMVRFLKEQVRKMAGSVRCSVDRNPEFFQLPTLIFCSFLDNVEIIVNKICLWKEKKGSPTI